MVRSGPMQYLAFVQRDEPDGFRATLPDFPGCTARAPSWLQMEDAIRMAVRLHAETLEHVPPPTPIEQLTEDSAPPNSCWMLVNLFMHEVTPPERSDARAHARPARERKRAAPPAMPEARAEAPSAQQAP